MKVQETNRITQRPALKVCLIGSRKPYPAFDSVSSILRNILGKKQVIELRINDRLSYSPVPLKFLSNAFQDLMLCLKIMSCYKREKVNAILLFQGYYPLSSIALRLLNTKLLLYIGGSGFYWSYLEHASTIGRLLAYANILIQKVCHKFADALITLSESMVEMIGLENYKCKTWYALPRLDKEFYTEFGIKKEYEQRDNVVGFVGPLCKRKGVINFIPAIPSIIKTKNDCKFLLIGRGPLLETTRDEIQKLKINTSVRVTGFVDYNCLKKYYNEMKLYVLPAYAEGIPSTIFEAMACGTPVLASPVGGIPDVIKDCETGFFLKSTDPEYIADRITKLLNDPQLLEKVSASAYKHVRENFSQKKVQKSWRKIFQDLGML